MDFESIHAEAVKAGRQAAEAAIPTPMVVQERAGLGDDAPVTQEWFVSEGPCGFAWVSIAGNTAFARWLKKTGRYEAGCGFGSEDRVRTETEGLHWGKGYPSGYHGWVWVGGQSITRKEAFARAFAGVLQGHDIRAYSGSRMD